MKVKIKLDKNIKEPYAVIFTDEITEEIKNINEILSKKDNIIPGNYNEKIIIIDKAEAEIIRTEEGRTTIMKNKVKDYISRRYLKSFKEKLGL